MVILLLYYVQVYSWRTPCVEPKEEPPKEAYSVLEDCATLPYPGVLSLAGRSTNQEYQTTTQTHHVFRVLVFFPVNLPNLLILGCGSSMVCLIMEHPSLCFRRARGSTRAGEAPNVDPTQRPLTKSKQDLLHRHRSHEAMTMLQLGPPHIPYMRRITR